MQLWLHRGRSSSPLRHDARLGRAFLTPLVAVLVTAAAVLPSSSPARAEDYPSRPITIIVPSTAGGGTDINARIVGDQLSKQLGQPVVTDDRPGGGSIVGSMVVKNATPDGYTLLAGLTANMAVNSSLFTTALRSDQRFRAGRDAVEISLRAGRRQQFPAHSVKELIALVKAKPGEIDYASAGNGTGQHLSMELFKLMTGTNITHVPYRGAAPAYADVISGQVPIFIDNLASGLGQIKAGTVRALAVTSTERSALLPDVPTMAEAGVPGYDNTVWFGLWAPKGTPQAISTSSMPRSPRRSPHPRSRIASPPTPDCRWRCRSRTWCRSRRPRSRNGRTWSSAAASRSSNRLSVERRAACFYSSANMRRPAQPAARSARRARAPSPKWSARHIVRCRRNLRA